MDFEPLLRLFRSARRRRRAVKPANLPDPFYHAADIRTLREIFSSLEGQETSIPDTTQTLRGECYICGEAVDFIVAPPVPPEPVNWRETLSCPGCGLINRWRSCIHLFEAVCEPTELDRIYLTETLSPVYTHLAARYPLLTGSEYVPHAASGEIMELHSQQVRNEDVTGLSFKDRSVEAVLCFDVLEHVPDYQQALREFHRVLSPGGQLVLSVPFSFQEETLVRAVVDSQGEIQHLMEPCYHGDPLSPEGVLSFYDFGMDLLADMENAGFAEAFLVCYRSAHWGYLQSNVAFIARKY